MKKVILLAIPILILSCKEPQDIIVKVDGSMLTKAQFEKYIPEEEYAKIPEERL